MGNKEAKFKKVFEEIDMNGDHKVSFFELAAFIISPKAVHELEEFTKALFINNVSSWSAVGEGGVPKKDNLLPYSRNYNPLLIRNRS